MHAALAPFGEGRGSGGAEAQVHPEPYTLHPTPYTLHPTPYSLNPTPYALNPEASLRPPAADAALRHFSLPPAVPSVVWVLGFGARWLGIGG